ncbi:hypothetical protein BJ998_009374 [Kutzneria kofuensis]|uniref:Uncharacterized protein n=1 Tax=Kutzneria kofuensis TaxID=103725 RepID=A0A7W9NMH1_9PSEU|nr:hypothetical protein [Kutzneria kofuensis]
MPGLDPTPLDLVLPSVTAGLLDFPDGDPRCEEWTAQPFFGPYRSGD